MDFENSLVEAAKRAEVAVNRTMEKLGRTRVVDEDDLTGVLVGNLDAELQGIIGDLSWDTAILRHRRGRAAEEKTIGADLLLHVRLDTKALKYSKGVLVQAKRAGPRAPLKPSIHADLVADCKKMLKITPASFVFDYAKEGMRCGSASAIGGSSNPDLYHQCVWTAYRFFLELFRCPIGDPRITSADVSDLPVPIAVRVTATRGDR
jgi:hypothetical protein